MFIRENPKSGEKPNQWNFIKHWPKPWPIWPSEPSPLTSRPYITMKYSQPFIGSITCNTMGQNHGCTKPCAPKPLLFTLVNFDSIPSQVYLTEFPFWGNSSRFIDNIVISFRDFFWVFTEVSFGIYFWKMFNEISLVGFFHGFGVFPVKHCVYVYDLLLGSLCVIFSQ